GFLYNEESLLFEMGLIMGTSNTDMNNNLRATGGAYDQDFTSSSKITKHTPGERSYSEITGSFINAADPSASSLSISYRSLVWNHSPYPDFVILEYKVKNTSATALANFHFGIFADWDISSAGANDRASWHADTKLGYIHTAQPSTKPQAGVQVLTGTANYFAIDNDPAIAGNPFGTYDGFTDVEKFTSISNGLARLNAGNATTGNDVSHSVSSGPYSINAGEEITIAFALHAAMTNDALISSAKYADSVYNFTLKAPVPVIETTEACSSDEAVLTATGAGKFNWYKEFTGGTPIFTGSQFTTPTLLNDTIFFVSNADNHYESLRTAAKVEVKARPEILISGNLIFCQGSTVMLSVDEGDEYTWSTGEKTQSIEVGTSGEYTVMVRNNDLECESIDTVNVKVNDLPSSAFTFEPEDPEANKDVFFSAGGSGGVAWLWDFGDGSTSTEQNPVHVFDELGNYPITLTATSVDGCTSTSTVNIGIITGIEQSLSNTFEIYPNPVSADKLFAKVPQSISRADISLYSSKGSRLNISVSIDENQVSLDVSALPDGIYVLKIVAGSTVVARKVAIARDLRD
ncbi:MAG TPA: PKD domain-containing protein, partial [Anaerolineales bacterium]|nr:PKD domain-containing protein [Anaerolineales bacterium]